MHNRCTCDCQIIQPFPFLTLIIIRIASIVRGGRVGTLAFLRHHEAPEGYDAAFPEEKLLLFQTSSTSSLIFTCDPIRPAHDVKPTCRSTPPKIHRNVRPILVLIS